VSWPSGVVLRTCSLGPDFGIVSGEDYGCDIVVSVSRPTMTWGATGSGGIGDTETLSFDPGQEVTFQLPVTDQEGWYIGGLPVDLGDGKQSHVYTLTIKPWIYGSLGRETYSSATLTLSNLAVPTGDGTLDLDLSVATSGAQGGTVTIPSLVADLQGAVESYADAAAASATAAESAAQTAHDISNIATTDAAMTTVATDPTSQFVAAQNARYAPQPGDLMLTGTGFAAARERYGDFYVRGWNLGKINSATTTVFWTTGYDFPTIQAALDKMYSLGANTVRITGSYTAYTQDAATHKARTHQVWDYAKSLGLKIIYAWVNYNHDKTGVGAGLSSAIAPDLAAFATDVMDGYAGDPDFFAWEIGNEISIGNDTDMKAMVTAFAASLRQIDPSTPICGGGGGGQDIADVAAYDPIIDFHDIHLYCDMSTPDIFVRNPLEQSLAGATKPVLVGEMGANTETSPSHMGDEHQAAQFFRAMRRWIDGTVMGCLVWNMFDDGDGSDFGMYESDHATPRARLAPVLTYPDRNPATHHDLVDYRQHPILLDNFCRPDNATDPGGALLGPAPLQRQGVWGISSGALTLQTTSDGGSNFITWDCKTGDIDFEIEFTVASDTGFNIGLALRYINVSNYLMFGLNSADGGAKVQLVQSGNAAYTSTVQPVALHGSYRLRMAVYGQRVCAFLYDKPVIWTKALNMSAAQLTTTQHGVFLKGKDPNTDPGTRITRVRALVPGRTF
jgi:hypothetical protein